MLHTLRDTRHSQPLAKKNQLRQVYNLAEQEISLTLKGFAVFKRTKRFLYPFAMSSADLYDRC